MLFNTIDFAVFFVIVLGLYWALRRSLRQQNFFLLIVSYVFYGWWDVRFLFLITLSTVIDYTAAIVIESGHLHRQQFKRVSIFILSAAFLFVVLYFDAISWAGLTEPLTFDVKLDLLFANRFGWSVFGGTALLLIALHWLCRKAAHWRKDVRRRTFVAISITTNLLILGTFKYFNFFTENLAILAENLFGYQMSWLELEFVLPVGISFYTFQTMSYTIDVYRQEIKANKKLLDVATYVAFFPQLVAGPIERGKQLMPQISKLRPKLTKADIKEGLWLITWGLFKKVVVADNVAAIVNRTFAPFDNGLDVVPDDGLRLLVAIYAFAIQIYCDFSGYTDIARGTARLLGFNIVVNFRLPYFATSPSSFWQRWHISLSSWLRDYLYVPLGGNRGTSAQTYRNLMLTMILGGLWHGAAWTFVVWGAFHGFILVIYRAFGLRTERKDHHYITSALLGLLMFHLTCLGWLFFRAQNLATIKIFLQSIFLSPLGSAAAWTDFKILMFFSWFLILFQIIQGISGSLDVIHRLPWFARLNTWIFVVMSLLALASTGGQEFIYFAF